MTSKQVKDLLLEYSHEGYTYMNEEQPEDMKIIIEWIKEQECYLDVPLYRRSDYASYLALKEGDVDLFDRVTSWSLDWDVPDEMYEGVESLKFILEPTNELIHAADLREYSFLGDAEAEFLFVPLIVKVTKRKDDLLYLEILHD